ncbi:predicted protein [Chaetoceros tenuissimus]|uniref:Uncharacterized protein n=1 Tax=Chaetoceros tenuissimus TaxID=426638 RepID=A0AAD3H4R3_9STRA|nr:predicted protein [Chaetoceros tenuissimus]
MNRSTSSSSPLPTHVLSHCFSFLGSSGHYYFLASVCRDFRIAVEELYQGSRNTSMDSIISSVSTYRHIIKIVDSNTICEEIFKAIFRKDRVEIFTEISNKLEIMVSVHLAIANCSTEIMRSIITDEKVVYEMMNYPTHVCVSSACDVSMIQYLMDKGVKFNASSVESALRRKDLETFRYLLDFVDVANEDVNVRNYIFHAAWKHEHNIDAMRLLKEKKQNGYDSYVIEFVCRALDDNISLDLVKILLEDAQWLKHDVLCYFPFLGACISAQRTDILSFIHHSIREIDVNFCLRFAEMFHFTEVIEFLQQM